MNYYEQTIAHRRQNFVFSMGIYDGRVGMQRALCMDMIRHLNHLWIPKPYLEAYHLRKKLCDDIQAVYLMLREGQVVTKESLIGDKKWLS